MKAYVFDYDETLVDFDNMPLGLFDKFKMLVAQNKPVWILTSRAPNNFGEIHATLNDYHVNLKHDKIIGVTPAKGYDIRKAEYLQALVDMGYEVEFWDDDNKTIQTAKQIKGVIAHRT